MPVNDERPSPKVTPRRSLPPRHRSQRRHVTSRLAGSSSCVHAVAGTANLEEPMDRSPFPGRSPEIDVQLGRAWRDHHRYLLDVAFRVLGSIGEAEDVVQEAYARLMNVDLDELDDVRAWLVVVVSRLCYDQLRSARWQRQTPSAAPPENRPAAQPGPPTDPADRVTLDDEVRMALHVLLARLTPAERTAYVLHDVFKYSFDDIADIVGRTPAASRQLAARARQRIQADGDAARFTVESSGQHRRRPGGPPVPRAPLVDHVAVATHGRGAHDHRLARQPRRHSGHAHRARRPHHPHSRRGRPRQARRPQRHPEPMTRVVTSRRAALGVNTGLP